ncbi:MAG: PDZ domain-containing protein [Acidobacteriota bacterium]|nr:PDZ domain-containing protein [Acidobacteriota bacterium]
MSTRKTSLFYAVLIAIASIAVGMVIASRLDLSPASSAQAVAVPPMNSAPLSGPIDATTFRNIAKAQIPTVVNIRTESRQRTQDLTEFFGGGGEDLLRRFFGGGGQGGGQEPPDTPEGRRNPRGRQLPQDPLTAGAGTGFIIDKTGFILTNSHVVEGADKITVSFVGGARNEEYSAKVVGHDTLTDSALLQLTEMPSQPLQEAKFGDSSQMQQGDWVMAIGNPFNLGHTVTVGVVSALNRPFGGVAQREQNMLQTDAAINPGNSGGPLLNVRGEVVGMNTAIYTNAQRSSNIGIGFATPINTIRDLLPQLRTGKISRGVIGVQISRDPLTKDTAKALGLPDTTGAVISSVNPDGPAAKAGLTRGDVIVEYNGRPVTDSDALVALVVATKPGTTVPVTIYRDNQRKSLNVTPEELDLEAEAAGRRSTRPDGRPEPTTSDFGMQLEAVTPEIARGTGLPRGQGGAIVADVVRGSAAARAGVQPNDVILEVNRQPVTTISQVTRALQNAAPGTPVFLVVWRDEQEQFITMTRR